MPPRLPASQVRQAYECPTCIYRRTFATSAPRPAIGPESPRYVEVPQPPQQDVPDKRRLKGILPVPRDIFNRLAARGNLDAYVEKRIKTATVLPDPSKLKDDDSRIAWKQRMADMRRKNLTEGLEALKNRKKRDDLYQARDRQKKQQEREALLSAPEREDERLTSTTLDVNLQALLAGGPLPDRERGQRIREKRSRVKKHEAARRTERQDNLHNLYIQARSYITTEDQLADAIDKAFGTVDLPVRFGEGLSPWATGPPPSVQDMLNRASGVAVRSGAAITSTGNNYSTIVQARLKRMAEELTGGRIPDNADEKLQGLK